MKKAELIFIFSIFSALSSCEKEEPLILPAMSQFNPCGQADTCCCASFMCEQIFKNHENRLCIQPSPECEEWQTKECALECTDFPKKGIDVCSVFQNGKWADPKTSIQITKENGDN